MNATKKSAQSAAAGEKSYEGFTEEERDAMKERGKELKASARRGARAVDEEPAVLEKIAEMREPDRVMAERLHALIKATVPEISPRLWYGMPAYAKDGDTICFFQPAQKFKTRYATLGFSDKAKLDDGDIWPCTYALTELTTDAEAKVAELLRKAVS